MLYEARQLMKNLPFSLRLGRCVLLLVPLMTANPAAAQDPFNLEVDDPFATTGDAASSIFGGATPASAAGPAADVGNAPDTDETNPIVLMLRDRNPQTPKETADGLKWMMRLKRYDEVSRLLSLVERANWSQENIAALSRAGGLSLWLKLSSEASQLSPAHQELLKDIVAAPSKLSRDAQWIDSRIDLLANDHPGTRKLARMQLQDASYYAINRLIERLQAGDKKVPAAELAMAAAAFGSEGVQALQVAATSADQDMAANVLLALAARKNKDFQLELAAALHGNLVSQANREALTKQLSSQYNGLPTLEQTQKSLFSKFQSAVAVYQRSRVSDAAAGGPSWTLSSDGHSVLRSQSDAAGRSLEQAAQLASLCLSVPLLAQQRSECLAVLLQAAYKRGLSTNRAAQTAEITAVMNRYLQTADGQSDNLELLLETADELEMHAAAISVIRWMASGRGQPALAYLDLMTRLLSDARPIVRYTALEAIAAMDPTSSFAGAEPALAVALEMSQLSAGPGVLVVGLHSDLRQAAKQQLETLAGSTVLSANSGQGALAAIQGDEPIEMIMIVDRVSDQSLHMLLQRIRNAKRSHALPIAVLTDELYQHERTLISSMPGVVQSVLARDRTQMQRVLDMLRLELDTEPMDAVDRARFAQIGTDFIARIGSDRSKYAFYPFSDLRGKLPETGLALSAASRAGLLSGLGSENSQRDLVEMAANSRLSKNDRLIAAAGFATSVKQFGMIIGDSDIKHNYELYNQLGPTDPVAAKSLGHILDVMEAQAGQSSWPDSLTP